MEKVIIANPNIRFDLIGLVSEPSIKVRLEKFPNVRFLGELSNSDLPKLTAEWGVGLIPFKLSPLILATNPVKMYEYASLGIPIVSTLIPEVEITSKETRGIFVSSSYQHFDHNLRLAFELPSSDREQLKIWGKSHEWSGRTLDIIHHSRILPRISIVVLMWNQGLMTLRCLESIVQRSDYQNLEIIVVDNDSEKTESEIVTSWLKTQSAQDFKYIRNSTNLGFAAGNNIGLKETTGDYIVILNNDTEVSPGWIWRSLKHFYRNPSLGILGPSTNNCGNEARVKIRGEESKWLSEVVARFNFRIPELLKVDAVAFFCAFIPREVFEKVGNICEEFGLGYFEDDDYCRRVKALDYEIGIARDVFVYHRMGASFGLIEDIERTRLFNENRIKFEEKWGKWKPHAYAFDADQA
jgi:GT2 family glycosyltransferase